MFATRILALTLFALAPAGHSAINSVDSGSDLPASRSVLDQSNSREAERGRLFVEGIPAPRTMLRMPSTETLTVPQGRIFVATGILSDGTSPEQAFVLRFNGQPVSLVDMDPAGPFATGMAELPIGVAAGPGTIVSLGGANSEELAPGSTLLGYIGNAKLTRKIRLGGMPSARQMVVLREGAAYSVPANARLVLTGLSSLDHGRDASVELTINGKQAAKLQPARSGGTLCLPLGFSLEPGAQLDIRTRLEGGHTPSTVYGYLQPIW